MATLRMHIYIYMYKYCMSVTTCFVSFEIPKGGNNSRERERDTRQLCKDSNFSALPEFSSALAIVYRIRDFALRYFPPGCRNQSKGLSLRSLNVTSDQMTWSARWQLDKLFANSWTLENWASLVIFRRVNDQRSQFVCHRWYTQETKD